MPKNETDREFCCRVADGTYEGPIDINGRPAYFVNAQFGKHVIRATSWTETGAWTELAAMIRLKAHEQAINLPD